MPRGLNVFLFFFRPVEENKYLFVQGLCYTEFQRAARLICMYMLLFAFIRLNTLDSSMLKVFSQSIICSSQ